MTGKRPRTLLRRTSSESLIEAASCTTTQERSSPLPEQHPQEKLKPTLLLKEQQLPTAQAQAQAPAAAAAHPRLVIGFNPKPLQENGSNECSGLNRKGCTLKPSSSPGSSSGSSSNTSTSARSPSSSSSSPLSQQQRSGLESLLSLPRERKAVEGVVGLGIVAAMDTSIAVASSQEELKTNIVDRRRNHHHHQQQPQQRHNHVHVPIAAAIKLADSMVVPCSRIVPCLSPYQAAQQQKQSLSIPIRAAAAAAAPDSGGSYCHLSQQQRFAGAVQPPPAPPSLAGGACDGQGGRAMVAWLRQADQEEEEHDTFLLPGASSSSFKPQQIHVVAPPQAVVAAAAAAAGASAAVHFLDACYFCKRHLVDGKDIYMYRGDKAFCSTDCRVQQILLDERHENCSVAALKKTSGTPSSHRNRVGTAAAA